ncbi:MAG: prepilin-type N-terminal cleavage/methylation domain-containing protein [Candidatus Aminicenantales bacterium]
MRTIEKSSWNAVDRTHQESDRGFSLIEVVVGLAIVAVALLGLAQVFTYSVLTNARADRMSNATFLAQQQIDFYRNLTADELNALTGNPTDELIDVNGDGTNDFRRITRLQTMGNFWEIRVLVFSPEQFSTGASVLLQNPGQYDAKADMSTIISR